MLYFIFLNFWSKYMSERERRRKSVKKILRIKKSEIWNDGEVDVNPCERNRIHKDFMMRCPYIYTYVELCSFPNIAWQDKIIDGRILVFSNHYICLANEYIMWRTSIYTSKSNSNLCEENPHACNLIKIWATVKRNFSCFYLFQK